MSVDDDFLPRGSLPEVAVDTEAALKHTRHQGFRLQRRRRAMAAGLGALVVVATGTVAGLGLRGGDGERITIAPSNSTTEVETPTTEAPTPTSSTTPPPSSTSSTVPTPTGECTRESVTAALGYQPHEVLSDPVCHDGWGWVDACLDAELEPDVGCLHAGRIIRLDGDRWSFVTLLLQDCSESFTAVGAPQETAEKFYRRCNP